MARTPADLEFRAARLGLDVESRGGRHLFTLKRRAGHGHAEQRLVFLAENLAAAHAFLEGAGFMASQSAPDDA